MIAPVTIGTERGEWAPPRPVTFDLDPDLNITNVREVRWTVEDKTRIRFGAVYVRGGWRVIFAVDQKVVRGQDIVIAAGGLSINVELPPEVARPALPKPPPLELTP